MLLKRQIISVMCGRLSATYIPQYIVHRTFLLLLLMGTIFYIVLTSLLERQVPNSLSPFPTVFSNSRNPFCPEPELTYISVELRRRLAETVAEVQREVHRLAGKEPAIDGKWSVKLAAVAGELDPRMKDSDGWDFSARLPDMGPSLSMMSRHVCPEVYYGSHYDHPFSQHGMESEKCIHAKHFNNVMTAILPASSWKPGTANFVIEQIRKFYDIPIIAIVPKGEKLYGDFVNVAYIVAGVNYGEANLLNDAVRTVTTPFVFIGSSMAHFSNQSSLERLVRVLDELEHVKVAGGAARDLEGHWKHGCLQQRMSFYQAYYALGYYHSKYECMYCDDLLTPFVTSSKVLRDVPFSNGISGPPLYRDWFIKLREKGYLAMSCPDVMFFVSNHILMTSENWRILARQWFLERIYSYDGQLYSFDCESIGVHCNYPLGKIESYLLPPCCIALMEKYVGYLTDYGRAYNLSHELQVESALGAVKMGGYLPWDYDIDIVFECKDFDKWMEGKDYFKLKFCNLSVQQPKKYIVLNCPHFFLELYCHTYNTTSQQFLPEEYQSKPTIIDYSGKDVIVPANPGLHCRNRMGFEVLRHPGKWRALQVFRQSNAHEGYANAGTWNPCMNPTNHFCLDHYPGDGNLPFLQPFLNL